VRARISEVVLLAKASGGVHAKRPTLETKSMRHAQEINPYIGEDRKGSIMFVATGSKK